jgi:two-component system response regulator MprA
MATRGPVVADATATRSLPDGAVLARPEGRRQMTNGYEVLVVDDDPAIRATVRAALELDGYVVAEASDGAAGLAALRNEEPCLVLLDMRMPTMDGWEFSRRYRAQDGRAAVVVMTAAESALRWCEEIGGDGCLPKPFDLDELYGLVERFCGRAA